MVTKMDSDSTNDGSDSDVWVDVVRHDTDQNVRAGPQEYIQDEDAKSNISAEQPSLTGKATLLIPTTSPIQTPRSVALAKKDLCLLCRRAFSKAFEQKDLVACSTITSPHHLGMKALERSARSGCALCQLFVYHVRMIWYRSKFRLRGQYWMTFRTGRGNDRNGNAVKAITDLDFESGRDPTDFDGHGNPSVGFEFVSATAAASHDNPFHCRRISRQPPLGLARQWVTACIERHEQCSDGQSQELPTRLIDVASRSEDEVKLVNLQDLRSIDSAHCEYAALSHCWGKRLPESRTTSANVNTRMKSGVLVADLENTFRDAIEVTRALDLKYLWIDSICILQDSTSDWQNECAHMADVYANAKVTIAATGCPGAYTGFLHPRSSNSTPSCEVDLQTAEGVSTSFRLQHTIDRPHGLYSDDLGELPLSDRAWVFQERTLSRRILHFGPDVMCFECLCGSCYEEPQNLHLPEIVPMKWTPLGSDNLKCVKSVHEATDTTSSLASDTYLFYDLVRSYTERKLTYGNDVLPALSALAARYQKYSGDSYLAGLWKSSLLLGLCWERQYGDMSAREQAVNLEVPSWSWASILGQVHWLRAFSNAENAEEDNGSVDTSPKVRAFTKESAVVLDTHTEVSGLDPFGQVKGGFIRLRAPVIQCQVDLRKCRAQPHSEVSHDIDGDYIYLPGVERHVGFLSPDLRPDLDLQLPTFACFLVSVTDEAIATADQHWNGILTRLGIVMQPVTRDSNAFRRIGHMYVYSWNTDALFEKSEEMTFDLV